MIFPSAKSAERQESGWRESEPRKGGIHALIYVFDVHPLNGKNDIAIPFLIAVS